MSTTPSISGLARLLVQHGRLSDGDAEALQGSAASNKAPFIAQLLQSGKMNAKEVAEFSAQAFGYPLLDLDQIDTSYIPQGVLDTKVMQAQRVVPLYKRGTRLFIGISDITNLQAAEEVRFQTGAQIEPIVVEDNKLIKLLDHLLEASGAGLKNLEMDESELDIRSGDDEPQPDAPNIDVDDAPVVKYLQKILLDAINAGASDVHFEPYEKYYRIRYRQDGILREIAQPPLAIKEKIASRIKVISKLDISEKRVPQDGRMKLVLSKSRAIDFRVSTLPTLHGEKIVMRILDPTSATLGIDALGYEPDQKAALLDAVSRPYGMVLVTGPTGSGKTVSLYTCLNILNEPGTNISTAEDPAEINLPGVNQVNVNDKAGLTFSAALKAFLRQDPDIIMVGEIRDLETADIAIKAAQTGHMVFSTLHTNDAPGTLTRLLNMGVAPFNVASSVILITAQRLARKLCTHCKAPIDIPTEALRRAGFTEAELDGSWTPYRAVGCDQCKDTGYKGRVGIYQVMPISDEMNRLIMKNGTSIDIADQARREGVRDLRQSGLLKVRQGMTSLEEIMAVTNE
ncbi:type IV-A pilus assembly ATPase PilB [Jeongeupia naejangsanensis]|uniref:Type IV-A pilus assembly ATPase PilB n=1 Tax=Jeongeupia naejangsanensis TaxID=613195 RepID=A0ABS2BQ69_9NEIS|nr:type IV-A pilus assembly ATPase PilB [Jeongeupia naejangsanensis]MBM3117718.1 type IV-A pilus assembly ATPase PilB [Jeongeupia naejangsanensis]